MTDTVEILPSPTWKAPGRMKRGTDRFENIELARLEMLRMIHVYRSYVGPKAAMSEVKRIIREDLAA